MSHKTLAGALSSAIFAISVYASPIPAAVYSAKVVDTATHVANSQGVLSLGNTFASTSASPLFARAHAEYDSLTGATSATAEITYYFDVTGAGSGASIPVTIGGDLWTLVSGEDADSASARASLSVTTAGGTNSLALECSPALACASGGQNWMSALHVNAKAGGVNRIVIHADASAPSANSIADAFADPFIAVDANYLTSHPGLSINVSAGVANTFYAPVSVAPEPSTFGAMSAGVLVLAAALRRYKR